MNHFQNNWSDLLLAMNFAQAILPHESTEISPYELKLGQAPRLHFNWKEQTQSSSTVREQLTREEAQTFAIRTQNAVKWAKSNLKRAQNRMTHQVNKHRMKPDFVVEDWVYVTRKGWITERPSLKLDHQAAGSYRILSIKGHSYVVNLPKHMKMNNVFHADCLKKASDDSLSEQIQDPEPSTEVNSQLKYTVNRVLASRVCNNVLQYQVTWEEYNPDSEWYDAEGFIGLSQKLKNFHDAYPNEAKLPQRLQVWLDVYRDGKELEPTEENNLAVKEAVKKRLQRKA